MVKVRQKSSLKELFRPGKVKTLWGGRLAERVKLHKEWRAGDVQGENNTHV